MEMIAVDPKLFITCRLCLEELGQYQIVPTVQQQIKYCFDIDVEQFDGFPQLICVKCKDVLTNYSAMKKMFIEKQNSLKNNLLTKSLAEAEPQQDTVTSTQTQQENINEPQSDHTSTTQVKKRLQSSSSSELDSGPLCNTSKIKKRKKSIKRPITWESDYKKLIVCRLCNSSLPNIRSMHNHYRSHERLRQKYSQILGRHCTVRVNKIDDKPNITGLRNMVVYSDDKILMSCNNYYILYRKESYETKNVSMDTLHNFSDNLNKSESSDDEIVLKPRIRRKRRLLSRSSNDTVVIETKNNEVKSDEEYKIKQNKHTKHRTHVEQCINIDDSSDSDFENINKEDTSYDISTKKTIQAELEDIESIRGIINTCVHNYRKKKKEFPTKQSDKAESKLKHIILSMGRKIIYSKKSINCTGVLKYMEQKNLQVEWINTVSSKTINTMKFIVVVTKLKTPNKNDNSEWEMIYPNSNTILTNTLSNMYVQDHVSNVPYDITKQNSSNIINNPECINVVKCADSGNFDSKNKLLNANPVANPKQLPKKILYCNDTRTNKATTTVTAIVQQNNSLADTEANESNTNLTDQQENVPFINNNDDNLCMPIITSTTSLAETSNNEPSNQEETKNNDPSPELSNQSAPRIKVKPVSELMSKKGYNLMKEQPVSISGQSLNINNKEPGPYPQQNAFNIFVPNLSFNDLTTSPVQMIQIPCLNSTATSYPSMPTLPTTTAPLLSVAPSPYQPVHSVPTANDTATKDKQGYLILDTVELPNTKTESPLIYFKNLLQIHNLILLNPSELLSQDFVCLIKFKVVFKQETKDQPVVLCLSLFCLRNMFCLKVKDIDISKISANWQWEILQIYTGEVVSKLLQNAQKVSQETYENTNNFLCLLKSINLKKQL